MSDTVLTIIGAVVGVAAFGVMVAAVIFFLKLASKAQANSTDSFAKAAAERGWQFEHSAKIGEVRRKWSGNTDGVAWIASHTIMKDIGADNSHWNHVFRWRASLDNGPSSMLILIHERSKLDGVDEKLQVLPGFIRGLAAAAIDHVASVFFGPEAADVDLSSWAVVEGHKIPAMRVMAPVADTRAFTLARHVAPPIISETAALAAGGKPPVILIRRDAVHLATTSDVSVADLERAVRLGAGIVRVLSPR
jgi:hypothetical protein